ncbi:hypothetical protein RJ55_01561 [Drechmeria coniospora]|nr:hypothetical protein RJ55_01561 [Drechmeria coniospora]
MPLRLSNSNLGMASMLDVHEEVDPFDEGEPVDFPELLARDLEISSDLFTAKNMTAGTPITSLAYSARPVSRMLGVIEEASAFDEHESDSSSTAPSFSCRRRESLMTAPTSVASTNWRPSKVADRHGSWIDDSDDEDPRLRRSTRRKSHSVGASPSRIPLTDRPASTGYAFPRRRAKLAIEIPRIPNTYTSPIPSPSPSPTKYTQMPPQLPQPPRPQALDVQAPSIMSSHTQPHLPSPIVSTIPAVPTAPSFVSLRSVPSVQSWLNSSLQPLPLNDDLSRVVPLPPDTMETLRVSISCFPETMLLSSSLTVDTIRTYSKKARQPELRETSRRSLWRKVVRRPESRLDLASGRPWEPLKNVFGCCSDYVCDALYAHIVAYNYVCVLANSSGDDEIPKKAASLLGLGRKRLSAPETAQDMQGGLLQCITRLVATARLMADKDDIADAGEADMLFVRSLCEIVRIAEA